jgi:HAD superfamily hydrolase (TIGR01509 family)
MKAVLFDADGVLFDGKNAAGQYRWQETVEEDLGLTQADIRQIFESDSEAVKGKVDTKIKLSNVLQALKKDAMVTPEDFLTYWLKKDVYINNKMLKLVCELSQPVYIATNQDPYRSARIKSLIGHHFQKMFTSCEIGYIKPEPGFYQHIEQDLQLPASHLLLIDDTKVNIESAKARGWKTHHFTGDFAELRRAIKGI